MELEGELGGEDSRKAWKGSSSFYNNGVELEHYHIREGEPSSACPLPVDTQNASININLDSDIPPP